MKIDGFSFLPMLSFSMAMTTFIGQNMGAGELERVKKGTVIGIAMSVGVSLAITLFLQVAARPALSIFTDGEEVISYGLLMMRYISMGYIIVSFSHAAAGVLRGAGLTKVPMVVMILCWCGLRMAWVSMIGQQFHDLRLVLLGYPVS